MKRRGRCAEMPAKRTGELESARLVVTLLHLRLHGAYPEHGGAGKNIGRKANLQQLFFLSSLRDLLRRKDRNGIHTSPPWAPGW